MLNEGHNHPKPKVRVTNVRPGSCRDYSIVVHEVSDIEHGIPIAFGDASV